MTIHPENALWWSFLPAGSAFVLAAFLFIRMETMSSPDGLAFADRIAQLRSLDHRIDADVLRIAQGRLQHYDGLDDAFRGLRSTLADCSPVPALFPQTVAEDLAAYAEAISAKETAVHRFVSHQAVLSNTFHYLPALIQTIDGPDGPSDRKHQVRVADVLPHLLLYHLLGDAALAEHGRRALAELRTADDAAASPRVLNAARHGDLLLDSKPAVDAALDRILSYESESILDRIDAISMGSLAAAKSAERIYRTALFAVCLLLVMAIGYVLIRLRQTLRSLRLTNDGLESTVTARTRDLHEAKDRLQIRMGEQAATARELSISNANLHQILSVMPSILVGIDTDGRILIWNRAAEDAFAIPTDQAVGTSLADCGIDWPIPDRVDGAIELEDQTAKRPDGSPLVLRIAVGHLPRPQGEPPGLLFVANDITEARQMESKLHHAQKLESIGQLAAGVAHEINTPMQFIGDNLRFLQTSNDDLARILADCQVLVQAEDAALTGARDQLAEQLRLADVTFLLSEIPEAISQSLDGVQRVSTIVRSLKEFSHPDDRGFTQVDLRRCIESTLTIARNEYKYVADLETDFSEDLPPVRAMQGELGQVLLNLVVNAAHAIEAVVAQDRDRRGVITVRAMRDGDHAVISVSDTGIGMPDEVLKRIYEPFFTTKPVGKGTGQGLYLAHSIVVQKHQGSLDCTSRPGAGTTFTIRLPITGPDDDGPA